MFASVPKHADARNWSVDCFLAASRLCPGGVIAYHSALELHGYAYSQGYDVQVIAPGEPRVFEADGLTCRFVKPPRGSAGPAAHEIVALFDRGAARDLFDVRRILAIEGLDRGWTKVAVLALGACKRRDWRGVSKDAIGCDSREFRRNLAICLPRDLFRDAGDVDTWSAQSIW